MPSKVQLDKNNINFEFGGNAAADDPASTKPKDKKMSFNGYGGQQANGHANGHSQTNGQTNGHVNGGAQTNGFGSNALIPNQQAQQEAKLKRFFALTERESTFVDGLMSEIQTAPLFTETIRAAVEYDNKKVFTQYGLLAGDADHPFRSKELFYYNVAAPNSVFICGSQGSGKSHTLSCLLENCLMQSEANELPRPLTGVVFHYDTFTSDDKGMPCEAAYLSSNPNIKVRVLCASTNVASIGRTYAGLPVTVEPLRIREKDLNTKRMIDLMAVKEGSGMPLYAQTIKRILKVLRENQQKTGGSFNYATFLNMIDAENFTEHQRLPLDQRLDNLESFMAKHAKDGNDWTPRAGHLTIVDLSCPCVTPESACQLFNICLSLFLEQDKGVGRVVALDEAHKYMSDAFAAAELTDSLLATIRLQRHLAARIFVSTQEPTISPRLLDLCSLSVVHRFTSPEWLRVLQKHLAGVTPLGGEEGGGGGQQDKNRTRELFAQIVQLRVGEALLFAPSAILRPDGDAGVVKLSDGVMKIRVRKRVTHDGGVSIMAN